MRLNAPGERSPSDGCHSIRQPELHPRSTNTGDACWYLGLAGNWRPLGVELLPALSRNPSSVHGYDQSLGSLARIPDHTVQPDLEE